VASTYVDRGLTAVLIRDFVRTGRVKVDRDIKLLSKSGAFVGDQGQSPVSGNRGDC
jgi:hypothetical protein